MNYFRTHVGNVRQLLHEGEDPETASVSEQLKVPEIADVATQESKVLHSDIEGSPYSSTPGRITLAEAAEQAKAPGRSSAQTSDQEDAERTERVRSHPARAAAKD